MFTVTPIGSCRITTPLRRGQGAHGLRLNLTRCYGYCHSPAEAVQLARFMRGDMSIPHDIWPLVSRSHDQAALTAQRPEVSDLYVVEIASAKELTIDGVSIQLNYLRSIFAEFFADTQRTQTFWDLADGLNTDAMQAFLNQEWSTTDRQRREAATLGRIRRSIVTRDSLRDSLKTLTELLPDMLVVTHVDAVKPDGERIKSRSALIEKVLEETRALGLPCHDPTSMMVEFGQSEAIEDDSTSLAHYTTPFGDALMADWMRTCIAPRSDALAATRPEVLHAQIEADCARGRYAQAAVRLTSLAEQTPHAEALLGDVQVVLERTREGFLARSAAEVAPDETMQAALDLGLFDVAAEIVEKTPGCLEALPCPLLTGLALAAEAAGEDSAATIFAIAACRRKDVAQRAFQVLAGLVHRHGLSLTEVLDSDQISRVRDVLTPQQIAEALQHADAPIRTLIALDMAGAELAQIAAQAGPQAGAAALAYWRAHQRGTRLRDAALVALLDGWVDAASALGDPLARARALTHLQQADPRHARLRKALRDAQVDLVARIRASGKAGDLAALQGCEPEVQVIAGAKPEFDLWTARLFYAEGHYLQAIDAGLAAAETLEQKVNNWVLLMRAASRTENAALVDEASTRVLELTAGSPKLKSEALKLRSALCVEA